MGRKSKSRKERPADARDRRSFLERIDTVLGRCEERVPLWVSLALVALFLAINANTLQGAFVLDDRPLVIDNPRVSGDAGFASIWTNGYWPDRHGLTLYRPLTVSLWRILWLVGDGSPLAFHTLNLVAGAAVIALLLRFLLVTGVDRRVAVAAATLFAVLPIHTEAVASVVGSAELLAAAFGLGALVALRYDKPVPGVVLFMLAMLSKESAAALAVVAWLTSRPSRAERWPRWLTLGGVIAIALWVRSAVAEGPSMIPAIDNATSLLPAWKRVLTALWVQCLYLWKAFVPVDLAADYSYKQIPLVMGLHDPRAWAGLALAAAFVAAVVRSDRLRLGAIWYGVTFLPASNLLFAVGTIMGERLAYLPSAGLALIAAEVVFSCSDALKTRYAASARSGDRIAIALLLGLSGVYAWKTIDRNGVWRDAPSFYRSLVAASPQSAKAHYFYGCLLSGDGDDRGAIDAYDRAIAIFPAYSEAWHNRANALARLRRYDEAAESYRQTLRFDPGHTGAAANLGAIEQGVPINPARRAL